MNGIIILAAGASRRMGRPKQLLEIEGENLLNRVIRMAKASDFEAVSVVVGAHIELILPEIDSTGVEVFLNPDWESGMSSTLACGLKHTLRAFPELESVLILLVDQPFITVELINRFLIIYQTEHPKLIAARYADVHGVPALFDKSLFPDLLGQQGQAGARKLIKAYEKELVAVDFPEGKMDLDTPEEWERFSKIGKKGA
jgi:molybdenum cofactor cytidylyltransferase